MIAINVTQYSQPAGGYIGYIQPDGGAWTLFVADDGGATLFDRMSGLCTSTWRPT